MLESHEHLIPPYLQGKLSPQETAAFERWMNQSEENLKMVSDFKSIWQVSEEGEKPIDFQQEKEWIRLQDFLQTEAVRVPVVALHTRSYALKIAAGIAFFLIFSALLYRTVFTSTEIIQETTSHAAHIILPDGSEVWLNENSRVTYQSDFIDDRDLTLKGEGFFEVKPNPEKPFVIHAEGTQIKVLGTSFNVKAYEKERLTEVFVVAGKVDFSFVNKNIVLTPGSHGTFNKNDQTLKSENEELLNIMAWKDKRLIFKKTPLREVVKTLRSYFKTDIQIKNEELLKCRFTSSFNNPTLLEVMETISLSLNLRLDHQSNSYSLSGDGCNSN